MNGRLLKFKLDTIPIDGNMDNFLNNIVMNRERHQMYISKGRIAIDSINENDYIFIQSNGFITHYGLCERKGPQIINENIELSIKNIVKFSVPVKSRFRGQGYNKLDITDISSILNY